MKTRHFDGTFAGFRLAARAALQAGEPPDEVDFVAAGEAQPSLFGGAKAQGEAGGEPGASPGADAAPLRLPRTFVALAKTVACHREPTRYATLYRTMWRLRHGEPELLSAALDPDVVALRRLERAVLRDVHKSHAFVRFREVPHAAQGADVAAGQADGPGAEGGRRRHFVAWYEPEYDVLALAVPHFVERFAQMDWSILTPDAQVHYVDGALHFGAGASRAEAPDGDATEALWATYYANIFNPARLNLRATRAEMPQKFWANMPETTLIRSLRAEAPARLERFLQAQPPRATPRAHYADLTALAADVRGCAACPWSAQATAAVVGEGPVRAPLMLVGEQPGDAEDLAGRPFLGPAGEVLARALGEAGIARDKIYVTNAVKHFKFVPRGKRRLHQSPNATDVAACRGWLDRELALVKPQVLVCLGTTAALAVRGQKTKLADVRGQTLALPAGQNTLFTYHPSAVLRAAADADRQATYAALVDDLRRARGLCAA